MREYWLWSIQKQAWWRPRSQGYTTNIDEAGVYFQIEAEAICSGANRAELSELMVPTNCPVRPELTVKKRGNG